jgi:hypothetical protein
VSGAAVTTSVCCVAGASGDGCVVDGSSANAFSTATTGSPRSAARVVAGRVLRTGGSTIVGPSHVNPGPKGLIANSCLEPVARTAPTTIRFSTDKMSTDASTPVPNAPAP